MSEPYKFTPSGTIISGIAEANNPDGVTFNAYGTDGAEHSLDNHPQFGVSADWDDVYMPQPKTREKRHAAAGSSFSPAGTTTLHDNYRYWPAHRDLLGGLGGPAIIKTEMGALGCNRYTGVGGQHSDEGYWNTSTGTNADYVYREGYLTSPAYQGVYYGTPNNNEVTLDGSSDSNYISSFVSAFAKGYFTNCCTKAVISANDSQGPTEWGLFSEHANIRYGPEYYDDDLYSFGCGGEAHEGTTCCTSANVCGRVFIDEAISADVYVNSTPNFQVGGLLHGDTSHNRAGRKWLDSSSSYNWIESDLFEASEPSTSGVRPGKFGVIDTTRTARHHNDIYCAAGAKDSQGSADASEKCTYLCNSHSTWWINQGRTYVAGDLSAF